MSQYYVYIHLEKYLAEWLLHQFGQNGQIRFPRGSAENDILEYSLTTQPADIPVPLKSPDSLAIEIPYFKTKDPRYYNFLPPRAKKALERTIYIRFRIELWNELHTFDSLSHNLSDLIWTFMEKHEIADDPKSWETIRQMYFRMRKTYQKKQQRNATSSKEEFNNTVQNAKKQIFSNETNFAGHSPITGGRL